MRIGLIGSGNLGWHLGLALHGAGHTVVQVFSRSLAKAMQLADEIEARPISSFEQIEPRLDLLIHSVPDNELAHVSQAIHAAGKRPRLVVHCAGGQPSELLDDHDSFGVMYPLQTFSRARYVDWSQIPILVTANSHDALGVLQTLAASLSERVSVVPDEQRAVVHLAATIACNFSNHMYTWAHDICNANKIDPALLDQLIAETMNKSLDLGPASAQTGPAVRNDSQTLKRHLELNDQKELRKLYWLLSENIQQRHSG